MRIKVVKTNFASKDQTGTKIFEYQAGEVYDIYQELAEVFISQGWGIDAEIETQQLEIETQDIEIEIETQDFPKKKKPTKEKDAN
jgi:hypothetical protein